jgi:hypothetical protein
VIRDHAAEAVARLPREALDGPVVEALARLEGERWALVDAACEEVMRQLGIPPDAQRWALESAASWRGVEPSEAWTDAQLRLAIVVADTSGRSCGDWPAIFAVARACVPDPRRHPPDVWGAPKSIVVDLPGLGPGPERDIAMTGLLRAVSETTQLAVTVSDLGHAFTLDAEGLGFDAGLLVELLPGP